VSRKSEHERLRALGRLDILDTPPEEAFDRITRLLPPIFGIPTAGISFVGETRSWLKATVGFDRSEIKRDIAFCAYAIQGQDVMVLLDTQKDPLFCENPLACGEAGIRFYAAAPLITDDGHAVGTVWIADRAPRAGFSAEKRQMLRQFAGIVKNELDLRLSRRQLADALKARGHVEERLRLVKRISEESAAAPIFASLSARWRSCWPSVSMSTMPKSGAWRPMARASSSKASTPRPTRGSKPSAP
jgi:GAF domain-containing protein